MGVNCLKSQYLESSIGYHKEMFSFQEVIGQGSFGQVWRTIYKKQGVNYAIKVMSKVRVLGKKNVYSVLKERQLLEQLHHPFLTNMVGAFQDNQNLYLIMDYLEGGDIRSYLKEVQSISECQTKFIILCIVQGLKHLHEKQILHRDIKPENIIIDKQGYCRIADLGIARRWKSQNSAQTSGTPGYMAPEVILQENYSYEVDYYSLGVMTYELLMGKRPFSGSKKQIKERAILEDVQINPWAVFHSKESVDFANRLLARKPQQRLGFNGIFQILDHPWLRMSGEERKLFVTKKAKSPLVPSIRAKFGSFARNDEQFNYMEVSKLLNSPSYKNIFSEYDYYNVLNMPSEALKFKFPQHTKPYGYQHKSNKKSIKSSFTQNEIQVK